MSKITLSLPQRLLTKANEALKNAVSAEGGIRTAFGALLTERPRGVTLNQFKSAVNALLNTFDRATQRKQYDVKKQQLSRAWRVVLGAPKSKGKAKRRGSVAKFLAGKYTLRQLQRAVELKQAE